jgi:large subunit ribosomal protein L13
MKTYMPQSENLEEKWFLVDAENQTLGRLAAQIAAVIRGKNVPTYAPHVNMRHHVVVINAEKVQLTGNKWLNKKYYRHSGWIGGLKETTAEKVLERKPTELLRMAVRGMIPHNRLGDVLMTHLRLFVGPEHTHAAQKPVAVTLTKSK